MCACMSVCLYVCGYVCRCIFMQSCFSVYYRYLWIHLFINHDSLLLVYAYQSYSVFRFSKCQTNLFLFQIFPLFLFTSFPPFSQHTSCLPLVPSLLFLIAANHFSRSKLATPATLPTLLVLPCHLSLFWISFLAVSPSFSTLPVCCIIRHFFAIFIIILCNIVFAIVHTSSPILLCNLLLVFIILSSALESILCSKTLEIT